MAASRFKTFQWTAPGMNLRFKGLAAFSCQRILGVRPLEGMVK